MSTIQAKPETIYTRKAGAIQEGNRLHGYAARFNEESAVLHDRNVCDGPFVEVIAPGAFAKTLRENEDIVALFNHDRGAVLGRTKADTLRLWEDGEGLAYENLLPDTTLGRDVRESVTRGDFSGGSFYGFVVDDEVVDRPGLPSLRIIREIRLVEITPVCTFPAYETTTVAVRERRHEVAPPVPTPALAIRKARLKVSAG